MPASALGLLLRLVAALALALATLAVASSRGGAVGVAVICTGGSLAAVPVDADGRPTGPLMACPDGVLALAGPPSPSLPVAAPTRLLPVEPPPPAPVAALPSAILRAVARGPPPPS